MTSPDLPGQPNRPAVPAYGEYAPPGDPRFTQPYTAVPPPAPSQRPLRRGDTIASAILLAFAFLSTVYTVLSALALEDSLRQLYSMYGGEGDYEPTSSVGVARATLIASHVILFAVAVLVTLALVRARRISFWVPLVAGAIAGIVFFATIAALVLGDPALLEAATTFTTG